MCSHPDDLDLTGRTRSTIHIVGTGGTSAAIAYCRRYSFSSFPVGAVP